MSTHSVLNIFSKPTIKNRVMEQIFDSFEKKIFSNVLNEFGIPEKS
jgi:hypothetical protein